MTVAYTRQAWADVDLDAVAGNVETIARLVAPARVCAVVKADAYGHGAVPVARAALAGGATSLAVALADEGRVLRDSGIEAPVLVLAQPPGQSMAVAVDAGLAVTVDTHDGLRRAAEARRDAPVDVQLKVDTGMHRVGAAPEEVADLAGAARASTDLRLAGLWTHLAVADEPEDPFTAEQLAAFDRAAEVVGRGGLVLHAANSAGAILHPASRYDMVRVGIAMYGYHPGPVPDGVELRPALSLRARVTHVRRLPAGTRPSYGRRRPLPGDANVATVPLGYADGVPRLLSGAGAEVLVAGGRRPLAGTVTMDQLVVDCGDAPVAPGDEVVLIGTQGGEQVSAQDWANLTGTISYEILTGIGARVPRRYRGAVAGTEGG